MHESSQVLYSSPSPGHSVFPELTFSRKKGGGKIQYVSYFPLPDTATWPDSAIWESGASSDQSVDTHDFREAASANQILSGKKESYSNPYCCIKNNLFSGFMFLTIKLESCTATI